MCLHNLFNRLKQQNQDAVEEFQSNICSTSLYGLGIGLASVFIASSIIGFQLTGSLSLYGMSMAHDGHIGLRFLYLMPFVLAFWGQYSSKRMATQAGKLIKHKVDEFQRIKSSWKIKSHHDVTHDPMTGLSNRLAFYNQLKESITLSNRSGEKLVLLSIDLDNFKDINSNYGHNCGDELLTCVAARLKNLLPDSDWISRTGGDEFSILSRTGCRDVALDIAERIIQSFDSPFTLDDKRVAIRGSIGIALNGHNETADELMQKAEVAMHAAKQDSRGYVMYSSDLKADNRRQLALLADLKQAIEEEKLSLYYQPKIDIKSKSICAVEALIRWQHDELGFISPEEFIPLAEHNRLITPITRWVIQTGMHKMRKWIDQGLEIDMCLNISTRDLEEPDLPGEIGQMLCELNLNPAQFTLEITENSIMNDPQQSLNVIRELSELGLQISIDDFGTGYSSLTYLSQLSANELKIDRSFVMGMNEREQDATIVKATIDLAHNLNMHVTAEGIEDDACLHRLDYWGCDVGQGYYFSPPLTEFELDKWLQESGWLNQAATGTYAQAV